MTGWRLRWLVRDPAFLYSRPCFSPDGEQVLFMKAPRPSRADRPVTDNDGPWGLWVVRADGGTPTPVFDHPEVVATRPDWSAASGRIAFTGIRRGRPQVWLAGRRGEDAGPLTLNTPRDARLFYPCWFPDGRRLVVTDYARGQVLEVDVDEARFRPLTDPSRVRAGMAAPWSDGGSRMRLAFAGQRAGAPFDPARNRIWVQDSTGEARMLDGRPGRMPSWSPDGGRLAFASRRWRLSEGSLLEATLRSPSSIYVQFVDGVGKAVGVSRALTSLGVHASHAKWSPDGLRLIATVSRRLGGSRGIALLEL